MEVEVWVLVGGSGGGPLGTSDGSHASSENEASLVSAGGPSFTFETRGGIRETLHADV